jgi:hypothetical protein
MESRGGCDRVRCEQTVGANVKTTVLFCAVGVVMNKSPSEDTQGTNFETFHNEIIISRYGTCGLIRDMQS